MVKTMSDISTDGRLIVAADYSPAQYGGIMGVRRKILNLAWELEGTGVCLKVNSILRAFGYGMVNDLHKIGVKVFADLKLNDIPNTMSIDAEMLAEVKPEIVTVMGCAGIGGIKAVKKILGNDTEVLVVTVLTSLSNDECQMAFGCSASDGVLRFARMAQLAEADGLILSPTEVELIKSYPAITLPMNAPNFRPEWSSIEDDDQNPDRSLTITEAFRNGLERAVMGRAIINAGPNDKGLPQNPREAVILTLREIEEGLTLRKKLGD